MSQFVEKTFNHIKLVQSAMGRAIDHLRRAQEVHDDSKFSPEERPNFERADAALNSVPYLSAEYNRILKEDLGPALEHHYANNSHHPEHYADGVAGMNLMDLIEMLCDWRAATQRNATCLLESIEDNQERFGYSDEVKSILINTANDLHFNNDNTTGHQLARRAKRVRDDKCAARSAARRPRSDLRGLAAREAGTTEEVLGFGAAKASEGA